MSDIIIVKNRIKEGYRRAGLALAKGDNRFSPESLTPAQLAALQADLRLSVVLETHEGGHPKGLSGNGEDNKTQSEMDNQLVPANLTVEQLKTKLSELAIEFKASSKKEELVALLEAALANGRGE
ncbi:HI1506-related protein [Avibacterium paragallinarum]|uniref:HI1506-related protein n=1 Tax=Avibacterium paragallinarum TaxID=728 RepID=UPI0021F7B1F1|nr:HI1506-related protein [Avibacterium paragallinarum]UXN35500.1 HI1506-related protein [Avibacterium paragallinarum]